MDSSKILTLFIFLSACYAIKAQEKNIVFTNYLKAEKILENAILKSGGISKLKKPLSFSFVGKIFFRTF